MTHVLETTKPEQSDLSAVVYVANPRIHGLGKSLLRLNSTVSREDEEGKKSMSLPWRSFCANWGDINFGEF